MDLTRLQGTIGYQFRDTDLLQEALTHRSYASRNNERLEFLGDSVLNCVISAELFLRHPELKEGELSRLRAQLVRQESLFAIAAAIELGSFVKLGEGEMKSGGASRPSILADAFEALVGAVYLDGGMAAGQLILRHLFADVLDASSAVGAGKDAKTLLQELLQAQHFGLPKYVVLATQGPAHEQQFEVECTQSDLQISARGTGASRRSAEQQAASVAYQYAIKALKSRA